MHLKTRNPHKETRPSELSVLGMFAQHMTYILAEKTLDALAKFLHTINIFLLHLPVSAGSWAEGGYFLVDRVIPRNVGDQIFDDGKRLHGQDGDGLVLRKRIHASLTGQARTAVNFCRARSALAGFAF